MTTSTEHPSQHREGIDHVWAAFGPDTAVALKDLVEACGVERAAVQKVLGLAKDAGVAEGSNGKWTRPDIKRTEFRDAIVLGLVKAAGEAGAPMSELVTALEELSSSPQVYNSLARLRKAEPALVTVTRDGTRSPRYHAA